MATKPPTVKDTLEKDAKKLSGIYHNLFRQQKELLEKLKELGGDLKVLAVPAKQDLLADLEEIRRRVKELDIHGI
jgi:hypothetical protein